MTDVRCPLCGETRWTLVLLAGPNEVQTRVMLCGSQVDCETGALWHVGGTCLARVQITRRAAERVVAWGMAEGPCPFCENHLVHRSDCLIVALRDAMKEGE